jgi:serine/threonine-protein kinase
MQIKLGVVLSHYRLDEKLGEGGMGVVYRAWDQNLERPVALKLIHERLLGDENARARFLREARTASALNHPSICVIHEVGEAEQLAYLVMEHIEGNSLDTLIPDKGLPVDTVLHYGVQLADALAHAHTRGIVHRDLKSSNVMVTSDRRVKVLDFGLAKRMEEEDLDSLRTRSAALTAAGVIVGTPAYLPPEILRGVPADARSDLWSLGVILYEMAAGDYPFRGKTAFEISSAILRDPPAALSEKVPAGVRLVIQHCLMKDPGQRYQSSGELRAALEALSSTPAVAPAALRPRATSAKRSRRAARPIRALAVLPLENLSGDPTQEYFADGMTDALITGLAKIGTLKVISRTSAMLYKGVRKPLPEIAKELKVDAVVEGSVLRLGDQVRITAQLIRAATDEHLWAETYDRDLRDILALQSDVARAIAREIQVTLTPKEAAQLEGSRRAVDPAAYEATLRGVHQWNKRSETSLKLGVEQFQKAIDLDPTYALAYSGLSNCYSVLGWLGILPPKESFGRGKAAALKAIELDKDLAEAHCSLGYALHNYDWDWAGAEREFARSVEINPGYATALHWRGIFHITLGKLETALEDLDKALELDPLAPIIGSAAGFAHYMARHYQSAATHFRRTLEAHPEFWVGYSWNGLVLAQLGRRDEAIAQCALAAQRSGGLAMVRGNLGFVQGFCGDRSGAEETLRGLQEMSRDRYVMPYAFAAVEAGLGHRDGAFAWLEKALLERGNLLSYLAADPAFDALHDDARFADLKRRIGLPG